MYLSLAPIWGKTLVSIVYMGTLLYAVRTICAAFPLAIQRGVRETWAFRRRLIFQMACLISVIVVICELYGLRAILAEDAVTYHDHYTWSIFLKKFVVLPSMILALAHITKLLFDKIHPLCPIEEDRESLVSDEECTSTAKDFGVSKTRLKEFQSKEVTLFILYLLFYASDLASECLHLYLFRRSEHITLGGHA